MIDRERLKEVLDYDPMSGIFTWKVGKRKVKKGAIAGNKRKDGYVLIKVDYKRYYAHRLAWLYVYGEWPKAEIDHINGDPRDNRIENIRPANRSQNAANIGPQSNNTSGVRGVYKHSYGNSWVAQIQHNGKYIYLGSYKTLQEAKDAYNNASLRLKGEYSYCHRIMETA